MLRKLLVSVGIVALSCSGFAQAIYKLEGEDAVTLIKSSQNGMYSGHSIEGTAFMYDLAAKKMTVLEGGYFVDGVSDNGIYVGSEKVSTTVGDKETLVDSPSYIKNGDCNPLPLPSGYTSGSARGINADGSIMVGAAGQGSGLSNRVPCIWTLQSDGSYDVQLLPTLEKDLTNRKPQAVDALLCSAKGDVIVGRMIDWTGFFNLPTVWTKKDTQGWELKVFGKDIIFKEGAVIPNIPDPEMPNAMDYYTAQDSATYNKAMEDYEAGITDKNPDWYKQDYITNPDSITKYNDAAKEYNEIMEIVSQKTHELYECTTGKTLDAFALVMSWNGNYMGTYCSTEDASGGGQPLSKNNKSNSGTINSPVCFDLKKGNWNIKDYIVDGIIDGITDNGDIFFATPNIERTRTAFVIPAGTDHVIDVAEWVKQKTNGIVDMKPDFSFSYEYDDFITGDHITVTDSLIVGDVFPSANGRVLLGTFYSPVAPEIITYFVNMDDPENIENTRVDNGSMAVYPNPATDRIYIKGNADHVYILDLSGRTVYQSTNPSGSIPVGMLSEGVYLVKIKAGEKTNTYKISMKK